MDQEKATPMNNEAKDGMSEPQGINLLSFDGLFHDSSDWRERIASAQKQLQQLRQQNVDSNRQVSEEEAPPKAKEPSPPKKQDISGSMSRLQQRLSRFKEGMGVMAEFLQKEKELASKLEQQLAQHNIPHPESTSIETPVMEGSQGLAGGQSNFAEDLVSTEEYLLTPEGDEDRPLHEDQHDKTP
jgi:signal recognition particle GTPase